MKNRVATKNKGFTLVELIIVIAVIAILAAVLAPRYIQYVERSRQTNDLQVAANLMKAAIIAVSDPENGVPAGVIVEIAWATDGNHSIDGAIFVRPMLVGSSLNKPGAVSIELGHPSLAKIDESISFIMGGTEGTENSGGANDAFVSFIEDAESAVGNRDDFIFQIHTSTGEIAITNESQPWVDEIGVRIDD